MAEHKRHQGHRQRMRERVQNYGLDSLAEHEALEYVLYLTNAQKDTNGIAHDLIDRFGDFAAAATTVYVERGLAKVSLASSSVKHVDIIDGNYAGDKVDITGWTLDVTNTKTYTLQP